MADNKLVFTIRRIEGQWLPMTVKCNVLTLREVLEMLANFRLEVTNILKNEQDELLEKVKASKLDGRVKRKYSRWLKSDYADSYQIAEIKKALKVK